MDNKPTYICDPEKNVNCHKSICKALGRGECIYTTDPEFAVNPDQPEFVEKAFNKAFEETVNESFEKFRDFNSVEGETHYFVTTKTNQDKLAEMVRTEDPMILADMIYDHTVCSTNTTPGLHYCPLASTCTKQGSQSKMECINDICNWLKEDTKDGV